MQALIKGPHAGPSKESMKQIENLNLLNNGIPMQALFKGPRDHQIENLNLSSLYNEKVSPVQYII